MEERRRRYEKELSEDSHLFRSHDRCIFGDYCFNIWLLVLGILSEGMSEGPN